jgi:hypothetical protein
MRRLSEANTTFRVGDGIRTVEAAPAELPIVQVAPYGATGVTVEIHSTHYNTAGYCEREHATAQLAYADAVVLVETLEEIMRDTGGLVAHARNAAQAARLRQRALEEFFDPRQLDLLGEAA